MRASNLRRMLARLTAIARAAGWSAHVMEQHVNNRIIRPTDDYTGPFDKKVVPIEKR